MSGHRPRVLFHEEPGWGFRLWLAFCALLGTGLVGALIYLAIAAAGWLGRH